MYGIYYIEEWPRTLYVKKWFQMRSLQATDSWKGQWTIGKSRGIMWETIFRVEYRIREKLAYISFISMITRHPFVYLCMSNPLNLSQVLTLNETMPFLFVFIMSNSSVWIFTGVFIKLFVFSLNQYESPSIFLWKTINNFQSLI